MWSLHMTGTKGEKHEQDKTFTQKNYFDLCPWSGKLVQGQDTPNIHGHKYWACLGQMDIYKIYIIWMANGQTDEQKSEFKIKEHMLIGILHVR